MMLGFDEGMIEGDCEGPILGETLGCNEGKADGCLDGSVLGVTLGSADGASQSEAPRKTWTSANPLALESISTTRMVTSSPLPKMLLITYSSPADKRA